MNFGEAIAALKVGKKVSREGWNGKGMFLFLADGIEFSTVAEIGPARPVSVSPSIVMKTTQDDFVVGWLTSQTEILAEDWKIWE